MGFELWHNRKQSPDAFIITDPNFQSDLAVVYGHENFVRIYGYHGKYIEVSVEQITDLIEALQRRSELSGAMHKPDYISSR